MHVPKPAHSCPSDSRHLESAVFPPITIVRYCCDSSRKLPASNNASPSSISVVHGTCDCSGLAYRQVWLCNERCVLQSWTNPIKEH